MSQSPAQPVTAFSPEYIAALRERDEPVTAADPDVVGPWRIWEREDLFHIFREWERFEAGHQPVGSFQHREDALLFIAALRACARPMIFRIRNPGPIAPEGYRVERDGEFVGYLRTDRAELLAVAHALSNVARSPVDLAVLFELAGSEAQEMAGEILGQVAFGTEDHTQNL
ncbi:MAG: hypothetical protein ACJ76N_03905 [Thermoanaerobaculia bacterium]